MRCEGYRKYGSFMTLGPRRWEQCKADGIVLLRFKDSGEIKELPACAECWEDCKRTGVKILSANPIVAKREGR